MGTSLQDAQVVIGNETTIIAKMFDPLPAAKEIQDLIGQHLRQFEGPQPTQLDVDPIIVGQYIMKLNTGHMLPPIDIVQLPDGREFITEGHHRYVAARATGKPVPERRFQSAGPVGFEWKNVKYNRLEKD